jgi:hypothetical protein
MGTGGVLGLSSSEEACLGTDRRCWTWARYKALYCLASKARV